MNSTKTQDAPLERPLSWLRNRRIGDIIRNKSVLDFGCGINGWTARSISSRVKLVHGYDPTLKEIKAFCNGVELFPDLSHLPLSNYEIVLALAVFEHIEPFILIDYLEILYDISAPTAIIFGTVPTPLSRPILEYLAYKLKLVNASHIEDHKVYYDELWLKHILAKSSWKLKEYSKFQFGLNSEFLLVKKNKNNNLTRNIKNSNISLPSPKQ